MELFVVEDVVAIREAELERLTGVEHLRALLDVAWYLRQRDVARALSLAGQIEQQLERVAIAPSERRCVAARLQLVRGEAKWLFAELDAADALADAALAAFTDLGDDTGSADANWLRALVAYDRGLIESSDRAMGSALACASRAGDAVRVDIAQAVLSMWEACRDPVAAVARWTGVVEAQLGRGQPAVAARAHDFLSEVPFLKGDCATAIEHLLRAREAALLTGQVRLAIHNTVNVGCAFDNLNDRDTAFEWVERALDLARLTRWPINVGMCLMQTGHVLWGVGRLDAAQDALNEAIEHLSPVAGSRNYASALALLCEIQLDRAQYQAALDTSLQLEERAIALDVADFRVESARLQARALFRLGRTEEALAAAAVALEWARKDRAALRQIEVLEVLAEIHSSPGVAPPSDMVAASAPLHYLQQAVDIAQTVEGFTLPAALLDALAREHAKIGEHAQAYEVSVRAARAREKTLGQEIANRAIAIEVRHRNERVQAEAEHLRQLAAAETKRAKSLEATNATLDGLGTIGQEITACLDAAAVFDTLERHVSGLLDATSFSVYLAETDGQTLRHAFGVEAGRPILGDNVMLADPTADSARCARERREISVELAPGADNPNQIAGTLVVASALFAPLCVGDRLLGVMTVQSPQPHAYSHRERLIFRSLCAYGAIALSNAATYAQLESALKDLRVTQSKLLGKNLELEGAYRAMQDVSLTDPLTRLRNRRFLDQHIGVDVGLCVRRYERWLEQPATAMPVEPDLAFFMVDLDHFKSVNDRHSHAAGDKVLVQMRVRLEEAMRDTDYLVRWGGEEFLVVARETNRADAHLIAERIRTSVAARPFELAAGLWEPQTCSIGFACLPFVAGNPRTVSWSQTVDLADQALFLAKQSGRNAWVGFFATARTPKDALLEFRSHEPREAARAANLRVASSVAALAARFESADMAPQAG